MFWKCTTISSETEACEEETRKIRLCSMVKTYSYTSLETAYQSKQKNAMGVSPLESLVVNSCWRGRASPKIKCLGASAAPEYGSTTICQAPSALLRSCSRKNHHREKINQQKTKRFLTKHPMPVGTHAKASI